MHNLIKIFKILSDKNRVRILIMLSKKKLCVCELQSILNITVSTVSKHLTILKDAGFIIDEKDGKYVNYSLNTTSNDALINQMILLLPMYLNDDKLIKSDLEKIQIVNRINLINI